MKANEFKKMSVAELQKELEALHREYFNLRMQASTGQLTRTHSINEVKKNIARVKTILREKELAGA